MMIVDLKQDIHKKYAQASITNKNNTAQCCLYSYRPVRISNRIIGYGSWIVYSVSLILHSRFTPFPF